MTETVVNIEAAPEAAPENVVPVIVPVTEPDNTPISPDIIMTLGEVKADNNHLKMMVEKIESTLENLKTDFVSELSKLKVLLTPEPEPEPEVEETPEADLPMETIQEIEIVPEAMPEVAELPQKRKRFFI